MDKRLKELAEQAGFQNSGGVGFIGMERFLTQFAELVRQDEREACAKLCDESTNLDWFAKEIRARGEK
jgi:hypothetical protein